MAYYLPGSVEFRHTNVSTWVCMQLDHASPTIAEVFQLDTLKLIACNVHPDATSGDPGGLRGNNAPVNGEVSRLQLLY